MKYSVILKQLFIIFKTSWIKNLLLGRLFSISSFEILTNIKQITPDLSLIIDVGANSGQFSNVSNYFYPKAKIYTFEPLEDHFLKVRNKFSKIENISVHNLALGNEEGFIVFNKNKYGHVSSVLDISEDNKYYPKDDIKKIEVKITKLDSFFKEIHIPKSSLMKLDVQGFELEALKGAKKLIQKIDYIVIEANLEKLYDKQPSFTEVNSFLNDNGFEVCGMLDFNLGTKNKYIELDILYKRV